MLIRERSRAVARFVWIALAVGWAGLPLGAVAGQPQPGDVVAGSGVPAQLGGPLAGLLVAPMPPDKPSDVRSVEPFNVPASDGLASFYSTKWREVMITMDRDRSILAGCRTDPVGCPPAASQLLAMIATAQEREGRARLGEVNRTLNLAIRYQSDIIQHGASDVWASPLATLSTGRGDCEDYAIAKYLVLQESGIPPADLRLVVVRDTKRQQNHAVLAVRFEDRWLVLDSRRLILLEDQDIGDYTALTALGPETGPLARIAGLYAGSGPDNPGGTGQNAP
jgi:predicted transglutaminase-like cysteine proteinase